MPKSLEFFKEGMKHFDEIGTFFETSKFVSKKVTSQISPEQKIIVELGAGNGNVTIEILKKMNYKQKLYSFEINKNFCKILREIKDARLKVINDSAYNFPKYVKNPDYVISILPIFDKTKDEKERFFEMVRKSLDENGKFFQFQYFPSAYPLVKEKFSDNELHFCFLNFPPGFLYGGIKCGL